MTIPFGSPKRLKDQVSRPGSDYLDIKETGKPYKVRLVYGPLPSKTAFWQTLSLDAISGEETQRTVAAALPISGKSFFDLLSGADVSLQKAAGVPEKKARSSFNPSFRYVYVGFDVTEKPPQVRLIRLPKSAYLQIDELEKATFSDISDPSKAGFLAFGPAFTWDVVLTKVETDTRTSRADWRFKYNAMIEPGDAPYAGRFPVSVSGLEPSELQELLASNKLSLASFLTAGQMKALETFFESHGDPESLMKPLDSDELKAYIAQNPIYLNAKDPQNGVADYYPFAKRLLPVLRRYELDYIADTGPDGSLLLPEPPVTVVKQPTTLAAHTAEPPLALPPPSTPTEKAVATVLDGEMSEILSAATTELPFGFTGETVASLLSDSTTISPPAVALVAPEKEKPATLAPPSAPAVTAPPRRTVQTWGKGVKAA